MQGLEFSLWDVCALDALGLMVLTLTYQKLQKSRVPLNSRLGFIIRTYKKVGFGRLR